MRGDDIEIVWRQAASTYYAEVEGRGIYALLDFEDQALGFVGGPDGDPVITPPAWSSSYVLADDHGNYFPLDAAPLNREMTEQELVEATDAALDEASALIREHVAPKAALR